MINVLASFVAVIMFVSGPVRDDTLQTLFTAQPMDRLIFRKGGSKVSRRRWVCDALCAVPLMLVWAVRMMLVPTLAVHGTAMGMASAESAVDIVLNSVAVGFIFEFDDLLYATLLSARARQKYENAPPEAGTCLDVPGSAAVAERYSWLLAVGDFGVCLLAYLKFAFEFEWQTTGAWMFTIWQIAAGIWIRGGAHALAGLHLTFRARLSKYKAHAQTMKKDLESSLTSTISPTMSHLGASWAATPGAAANNGRGVKAKRSNFVRVCFECARVVLSIGLVLASSAFVIKVCYQGAFNTFSYSVYCLEEGSPLKTCLDSWVKSDTCSNAEALSAQAPGSAGLVLHEFSYEDVFWSLRDWGPTRVGCLPQREVTP